MWIDPISGLNEKEKNCPQYFVDEPYILHTVNVI